MFMRINAHQINSQIFFTKIFPDRIPINRKVNGVPLKYSHYEHRMVFRATLDNPLFAKTQEINHCHSAASLEQIAIRGLTWLPHTNPPRLQALVLSGSPHAKTDD
ncbi:MAG: hypothetical protein ACI89U_001197 [Gammaproteobacteria bacterium]|jgi:hypothetical protein